jgi:outer membrane protein TolC
VLVLFSLYASNAFAAEDSAAPLKRVTFQQALRRALSQNPAARIASQEILRSEALVREARAGAFPTLMGTATGTRIDHDRALGGRVIQGANALSANIAVGLPLVAPQRWALWAHAKDNAELSRVSAGDIRRSLAITAARAYLAVVAQQRAVEITERAFATAKAHYDFAHGRLVGGVGNALDEARAAQLQETTRASAELARAALAKAQEALGVIMAEDAPVDATPQVSLANPPSLGTAVKEAPGLRSDVLVQRGRVDNAMQVTKDSYTDYLPSLTAQFLAFYQNPATMTAPTTGWQAQLILSVPFYDGGQRYGAHQEREALESESKLALENLLSQVRSEVRTAFEQVRRAELALDATNRAAELAHRVLALANEAYRAGATTNLDVIDAERSALDADTAATVAEDTARQSRLDLLAASGRFP